MNKPAVIPAPPNGEEAPQNPRNEAMAEIAAQSRKDRDDLLQEEGLLENPESILPVDEEVNSEVSDPNVREVPSPEGLDNEKIVDKLDIASDTPVIERDGELFLSLKIGDIEKEIPLAEALVTLQKDANADVKTLKADQALKAAEALKSKYEEKLSNTSTQPDDRVLATPEMKEDLNKSLSLLYEKGDVAAATDLLTDTMNGMILKAQPRVDIQKTVADSVALAKDQERLDEAFEGFKETEKYESLLADDFLKEKVDLETEKLLDDAEFMKTKPSYKQMLEKAGDQVLDWVGKLNPSTPSEAETVVDLKRQTASRATTRTVRRGAPQPKAAPSKHDNIAAIAKARGQELNS